MPLPQAMNNAIMSRINQPAAGAPSPGPGSNFSLQIDDFSGGPSRPSMPGGQPGIIGVQYDTGGLAGPPQRSTPTQSAMPQQGPGMNPFLMQAIQRRMM